MKLRMIACIAAQALILTALTMTGCRRKAENVDSVTDITETVHTLQLEIGAADIRIREGDILRVETDNPYITTEIRNGVLTIREKPHVADLDSSEVILEYPAGTTFREADMEIGAGRMEIEFLTCGKLELELGAGQTVIHNLTVTEEADISGGAGQILIHSGEIRNLDMELGVGESSITAVILGNSEIEAGVGSLDLTIPAPQSEYTLRTKTGIGSVSVNGTPAQRGDMGTGPNRIELAGGVGQIRLSFTG